mgnify:CR=1 FL=1
MIGFDGDGNVMGGPGNIADAAVGTAGAMEGATASEGLGEISGGPGLSAAQVNAVPTMSVVPDKSLPKQVTSFTNALKAAMSLSPTRMAMSLIANVVGNPPNEMMSQSMLNQGLIDQFSPLDSSLATPMGHPHMDNMMSVPMSGFGARLGIATARDPHTGLNMGPGRPGEPGDVNPFSGVMYGEGSDPYIRPRRGTEIAELIHT